MAKSSVVKAINYFPLTISSMLVIINAAFFGLVLRAEHSLFSSLGDRLSLDLLMVIVLLLSLLWMFILSFESLSQSMGKLLRFSKWMLFFIYYPLGKIISKLFFISKSDYQTSFLAFQNQLFFPNLKLSKDAQLLLLLPHCLQFHECKIRITRDIADCADCGECDICMLKDLGKKHNIKVGISNGGTLARKIVHDTQPEAIIAVACHRDLTDGVRESWNYPVYGILNERPYGPCVDTKVDVESIERVIKKILI
jgi:hypothetical protein